MCMYKFPKLAQIVRRGESIDTRIVVVSTKNDVETSVYFKCPRGRVSSKCQIRIAGGQGSQ